MNKNDSLIKNQAIIREYEMAFRRKREPKFLQSHGNSVVGSIHDCNRDHFERVLKAYWDKLYVGWNPYKKDGQGCWEVWSQPSKKTLILQTGSKDPVTIYTLEYRPSDMEHWVADLDYLSYDFINKLRSMDAWENKQLVADHDEAYEKYFDKLEDELEDNIKQVVKENKQTFRDLLDYTRSGYNPLDFFQFGKKS